MSKCKKCDDKGYIEKIDVSSHSGTECEEAGTYETLQRYPCACQKKVSEK